MDQYIDYVKQALRTGADTYFLSPRDHAMGHYSRYMRPGYTRIAGGSSDRQIKVSAFKKNNTLVLVIINESVIDRQIDITLRGVPATRTPEVVQSGSGKGLQALEDVKRVDNRFLTRLPSNSITTFIGNAP